MKKVEIKEIEDIANIIELLKKEDFVNVTSADGNDFVAVSSKEFSILKGIKDMIEESQAYDDIEGNDEVVDNVRIISKGELINENISVEQYEFIKKQINLALEKTFKPKPEKLN